MCFCKTALKKKKAINKKARSCISDKVRQGFKKLFIGGCHKLSAGLKAPGVDNLLRHSYMCEKDWLSVAETEAQRVCVCCDTGRQTKKPPHKCCQDDSTAPRLCVFLRLQANRVRYATVCHCSKVFANKRRQRARAPRCEKFSLDL